MNLSAMTSVYSSFPMYISNKAGSKRMWNFWDSVTEELSREL